MGRNMSTHFTREQVEKCSNDDNLKNLLKERFDDYKDCILGFRKAGDNNIPVCGYENCKTPKDLLNYFDDDDKICLGKNKIINPAFSTNLIHRIQEFGDNELVCMLEQGDNSIE